MHEESMCQLAYFSQRSGWVSDDEVVNGIVLPAILKNRRLGVAGCLWFDSNGFMGVLEGERGVVLPLFERIRRDDRHTDVELVADSELSARSFERFEMHTMQHGVPAGLAHVLGARARSRVGRSRPPVEIRPLLPEVIRDLARLGRQTRAS